FVTAKSVTGFTVRGVTLEGQPARCGVDYRIVAKRLGYENVRLERAAAGEQGSWMAVAPGTRHSPMGRQ
ncbi:MAG: hypothetical protein ACE5HA_17855, partial [Anaerolineae bacterium]